MAPWTLCRNLVTLLLLTSVGLAACQFSQEEQDAVAKYAPVFQYHPGEEAYPCSIEYILASSGEGQSATNNTAIAFPAPLEAEQLVQDGMAFPNTHLVIPSSIYAGFVPGRAYSTFASPDNATVVAPLYVAVQHDPNNTYVDISYIQLYAYQPGQAVRPEVGWSTGLLGSLITPAGKAPYNMVVETFGSHQGDIERVVVRLSPDYSTIQYVGFEQHGTLHWANTSSVIFENGTHPVSRPALNGHANYNPGSIGSKGWGGNINGTTGDPDVWFSLVSAPGYADVIDLLAAPQGGIPGPVWRPWQSPSQLLRVDLTYVPAVEQYDRNVDVLSNQTWALFRGHMGLINVTNTLISAHRVGYSYAEAKAKTPVPVGDFKFIQAVFTIALQQGLLPATAQSGDAPPGLGARNYVFHNCTYNGVLTDAGVTTSCLPGPTANQTSFTSTPGATASS